MKKSFRLKVVLAFTVGILLCVAVLIMGFRSLLRPIFIWDTKNVMENYAQLVIDTYTGGSTNIKRTMDMIDSSHDIQSALITPDCEVLINSGENIYPSSYKVTQLREWFDLYSAEKGSDSVLSAEITDKTDNLGRVVYIEAIDESTFICMSKVVRGVDQEVRMATLVITAMGVIIILMGAVIWGVVTRPFTKQMEKMSKVTKKMSRLQFDEKLGYSGRDEIGQLASSIDEMGDELNRSINKLQQDVERRKRLIRDISHELKTPVTTVRGYTETIEIVAGDNERIKGYCSIMLEECDVIESLLSELLYMSKLEDEGYKCRVEDFDTAELEDKLKARIRNEFGESEIVISFEKATLCANETLAERAVYNYISNAVRYRTPDTAVKVKGYSEKGDYVFAVSNYGKEISAEDRELIWDVFYKGDKSRTRSAKGHGIGLTMVRQIASLHGGEVAVESEKGINTFIIRFPEKSV